MKLLSLILCVLCGASIAAEKPAKAKGGIGADAPPALLTGEASMGSVASSGALRLTVSRAAQSAGRSAPTSSLRPRTMRMTRQQRTAPAHGTVWVCSDRAWT